MNRGILVLSITVLLGLACGSSYTVQSEKDPTSQAVKGVVVQGNGGNGNCALPPSTFQESDLVGTWLARPGKAIETLVLKVDHTYQQTYVNRVTNEHYESPWQEWQLEHRENGIFYLHLRDKRMCHKSPEDCLSQTAGGGASLWYDFCEGRVFTMQGEVVLLITGVPARFTQPPHGIELVEPLPDPDTAPVVYSLQP
jgi:hypothetical protein